MDWVGVMSTLVFVPSILLTVNNNNDLRSVEWVRVRDRSCNELLLPSYHFKKKRSNKGKKIDQHQKAKQKKKCDVSES